MFGDFLTLAMDSLVNQATKYWFLTQEQVSVPLVIRSVVGAGGRFGAIHSQMPASWFMGVPGLKIVAPVDAGRREGAAQGRRSATTTRCSSSSTSGSTGSRARWTAPSAELGEAAVVREGSDVTLVTAMKSVHDASRQRTRSSGTGSRSR